jgi:nucleoside-diphosphate-sugar epimerase
MTTLITGGTGLIGTTLADQLLSGGERVVLLTHMENTARARAGLPPLGG